MCKFNYIQADIIETERSLVRKLTNDDFDTLLTIMGKPEVMYAWEHDFSEDDVQGNPGLREMDERHVSDGPFEEQDRPGNRICLRSSS